MKNDNFSVEETSVRRADGTEMLLRIARPTGIGPFPAVIDVHGGGWVSGDRNQNAVIDDYLARNGIVAVAPEFRMPPQARYPTPISDILLAMHWLRAEAGNLGSRPDLVGGVGTSSGGHQLLEAALRPAFQAYRGEIGPDADLSLCYLVMCWPVADPLRRFAHARAMQNQQLLKSHEMYWPSEADMETGNPQLVLERGLHGALPPLLVVQGTADDNLPEDSAERLVKAWQQGGGSATLELYEGQPHTFVTRSPDSAESRSALAAISGFIHAYAPGQC